MATTRASRPAPRAGHRGKAPSPPPPQELDFTIITGLSGAGRSEAAKCLEDLGYFVVDNLPPALIGKMAELAAGSGSPGRVAIVADVRGGVFFGELSRGLQDLKDLGVPYRILFLEGVPEDFKGPGLCGRHNSIFPGCQTAGHANSAWDIQLIDSETGGEVATLPNPDSQRILRLVFGPDGSQLAVDSAQVATAVGKGVREIHQAVQMWPAKAEPKKRIKIKIKIKTAPRQ